MFQICSRVLSIDVEEKYEEIPPPLPASPPPAEAPPPTPVAPTPAPAPVEISMLVQLGNDTEAQEIDVSWFNRLSLYIFNQIGKVRGFWEGLG